MGIDKNTQNKWILGDSVSGVNFSMNQPVRIIAGPHNGKKGTLISIYSVGIDPVFHLETRDGKDLRVRQSELAAIDT